MRIRHCTFSIKYDRTKGKAMRKHRVRSDVDGKAPGILHLMKHMLEFVKETGRMRSHYRNES